MSCSSSQQAIRTKELILFHSQCFVVQYEDIFRRSKDQSENNFDYIIYLIIMNVLLVYSVKEILK